MSELPLQGADTRGPGSPLWQEAAGIVVPRWGVAGPGSGLSEEPMSGIRSVTLYGSVGYERGTGPVPPGPAQWPARSG